MLLASLSCELSDKQVGLDPEPSPVAPGICLAVCEQRTECIETEAYECLRDCYDDLEDNENGQNSACNDARLALHACHLALPCDSLTSALDDPGQGDCAVEHERARC